MSALIYALVSTIHLIITLYIWIVIIAALITWVQPNPYNPIVRFLTQVTEPVFTWIRRKMPFVVVGGVDLSPVVVIIALQFVDIFLTRLVFG
ncbi:YggT family protein [Nitratifractor sp.]